jgi:hypothetical protein
MQEWDDSIGYWTLVLYTLEQAGRTSDIDLMIVVESLEEADMLQLWAQKAGWSVQSNSFKGNSRLKKIFQELNNLARFLLIVHTCFHKKLFAPRLKKGMVPGLYDEAVLIVSQFYKNSFKSSGEYTDPFFGSLYKDFIKSGKRYFILADSIDLLDRSSRRTIEEKSSIDFFMVYSILNVAELIAILWGIFIFRLRIGFCRFDGCDISPMVRWYARRFNFLFNFNSAVLRRAVQKVTKMNRFDKMLIVFEDNVHERAAIQGFRDYSAGLKLKISRTSENYGKHKKTILSHGTS